MTHDHNPYGGYPFVDTEPKADPNAVPVGSTKEILTWVKADEKGGDRAERALALELERDKPRQTLLDALQKG